MIYDVSESSSCSGYEGVFVNLMSFTLVKMCTFCVGVYVNKGIWYRITRAASRCGNFDIKFLAGMQPC